MKSCKLTHANYCSSRLKNFSFLASLRNVANSREADRRIFLYVLKSKKLFHQLLEKVIRSDFCNPTYIDNNPQIDSVSHYCFLPLIHSNIARKTNAHFSGNVSVTMAVRPWG